MQPYADNFILVIPVDETIHTNEYPFCDDPSCPCHEDTEAIARVTQQLQDGLLTETEATSLVAGKMI